MELSSSFFYIDTSTPESLERDFYAWLHNSEPNYQSSLSYSLPPLQSSSHDAKEANLDMYSSYTEDSISGSPSSVSSSSGDDQHTMKPVIRSSGRNQLGRNYSPGLPLSMNEREEIVRLFQTGWKICDISKSLCVTHSCVSKILNRYRQTGSVRPKDAKEGRTESALVLAIRDYKHRFGISRQSEIREQLIRDGICTRENAPTRSSINQGQRGTMFPGKCAAFPMHDVPWFPRFRAAHLARPQSMTSLNYIAYKAGHPEKKVGITTKDELLKKLRKNSEDVRNSYSLAVLTEANRLLVLKQSGCSYEMIANGI